MAGRYVYLALLLTSATVQGFWLPSHHPASTAKARDARPRRQVWTTAAPLPPASHGRAGELRASMQSWPVQPFKAKLDSLAFDKDAEGILRLAYERGEEFTAQDCADALLKLGNCVMSNERQRSSVVSDARFASLWSRAMDLLPWAKGRDLSTIMNAIDKLRYRPPYTDIKTLLRLLRTKQGALTGKSVGYVLGAMVCLNIQPDASFMRAVYDHTSRAFVMWPTNPFVLSSIVRMLGHMPASLPPPPIEYMPELYRLVQSYLPDFTTKDMRRLLYGLCLLSAKHQEPPPSLLPALERTLITTGGRYTDACLVGCLSALAQLPGVDRTDAVWGPLCDQVQARLPSLTIARLDDVFMALKTVGHIPSKAFLHDCIFQVLLPRCDKEPVDIVLKLAKKIAMLHPSLSDRAVLGTRLTRSLESRVQGVDPALLSWVVGWLNRREGVPLSRAFVTECVELLTPYLTSVMSEYYWAILDSLLQVDLPVPSTLLKSMHYALSQPWVNMSPRSLACLVNTLINIGDNKAHDPALPPLIDLVITHLLPQRLTSPMSVKSLGWTATTLARLATRPDLATVPPSMLDALADRVRSSLSHLMEEKADHLDYLKSRPLVICLHGMAKAGYFNAPLSQDRTDLLHDLLMVIDHSGLLDPSPQPSRQLILTLTTLTNGLAHIASSRAAPDLAHLHARLSTCLAVLTSSLQPDRLSRLTYSYGHLGPLDGPDRFLSRVAIMAGAGAGKDWPLAALCGVLFGFHARSYDPGEEVMDAMQQGLLRRLRQASSRDARLSRDADLQSSLKTFATFVRNLGYRPLPEIVQLCGPAWAAAEGPGLSRAEVKALGPEHDEDEEEEEGAEEEDWHLSLLPDGPVEMQGGEGGGGLGPWDWGELGGSGWVDEEEQEEGEGSFTVVEEKRPSSRADA